ncbi:MAG: hypothetical protein ACK8QZ_00445 [Anaerolineales bacterium]
MTELTDKIIATMNAQKGELIGINAMLASIVRVLPGDQLEQVLEEFDTELAVARSTLAYSSVPEEVISGLESYVQMWNVIRVKPNQD